MPEPIDFPTAGGAVAHALYYPPANPGFTGPPGDRPPLLVVIHGGPTSAARVTLRLSYQYWTTRGFAVVDVNYRGSTRLRAGLPRPAAGGVGRSPTSRTAPPCARFLVERGDVDRDRLCIRGGSAGGFTTLAALAFEDVFAPGPATTASPTSARWPATPTSSRAATSTGSSGPWPEAQDVYEARSPIFHVDTIDRPLVVFQGLEDEVVPPNQAEMIVDAVRSKGVPVAYVTFEGEQHGFRQAANIRASLDGELSFYAQVLRFELPAAEGIEPIPVDNLSA